MGRSAGPSLETLEARALLSSVPSNTPGLVDSLTAVASRVSGFVHVALTFTETNVSHHDINVTYGPSDDNFLVSKGKTFVWNQDAGQGIPAFLQVEDLKPGQSLTVQGTWNGQADDGPGVIANPNKPQPITPTLSGKFTVSNALDHRSATATVTIPSAWAAAENATALAENAALFAQFHESNPTATPASLNK